MKITLSASIAVITGALLTTTMISPAFAAMQRPGKITCEEFVALDDMAKPKVVYWAEGFNKKGKPDDAIVDIDETDRLGPMIVTECKMTPKEPFMKTMKAAQDKSAKASASTPKPK
jgi:hypothetical protein